MSRRAASSAIGDYFCSNSTRQGNSFSPKLRSLDLRDAFHLFDEMVRMHPQPSVFDFTKLLSVAVKTKHYSFALHMFDQMRLRKAPMDVYTFNIAINCYCLQKRLGSAFAVMTILLKSGYRPTLATFTPLIKGLFSDNRVSDAVSMFENLLDLGMCKPDDRMILTMIDGLCKAGEIVAAHDLIRIAKNARWRVNVYAYNALVNGFCKERMMKEAEDVLQYMKEQSISPNIVTYTTLINGYCLQGDLNKAKRVLDSLSDTDIKPDIVTYGGLIMGYLRQGRLVKALLLFLELPYKGLEHDRYIYNIMMYGLFSNNKFVDGWKLLKDMELRGVPPDIFTCTILLDGLCQSGKIDQALLLLHMIEQDEAIHPNAVTYNVILRGLLKRKWLHETKLVLEVMHERGFSLSSGNLWMLRNQMR